MSDIITRLLLKTNDFDANLEKSKRNVNGFQNGVSNMAKTAGTSVMKFAGGLGLAISAGEGLMKTINSSQTTGDAYVKMMDQAKASVDSFFASIALGNFDGFLSNLQNVIDKAGELSVALDNLGTKTLFNKAEVDDLNTKYMIELNAAKARNISDEERNKHLSKAKEYLMQMASLQKSLASANADTSYTALQAEIAKMGFNKNVSKEMWDYLIKDSNRPNIEKTSAAHKNRLFEYNKRIENSKIRDPYTEQVIDSDETKKIRKELKKYKESRFGLYGELNKLFIEAADDENSVIAQALKMRAAANSLKVAVSNKELEVANTDAKINGSYKNKNKNGGSGGDGEKVDAQKGSIAWYDSEIAKLNKKLISETDIQAKSAIKSTINELEAKKIKLQIEESGNSIEAINIQLADLNKKLIAETDMQARATIQTTINELEQKKINLKFVVDQEAFKIAHGEMKDGALSVPIKPTYKDEVPTHGKDFKLPKYEPLFKKEDIDFNNDYAESLSAIGGVMAALTRVTDDSAASYLQWGANVVSSIAQAIPAIMSLTTAKTAEAAANSANSAAQIPFVGWLAAAGAALSVVAAMASIPKFATGGIVPGASFTGDKVPALLNSGEMVLNAGQQSNLFKMLNSGLPGSLSQKIQPSAEDRNIRLYSDVEIRGDRLFLVLNNHIKKTGKRLW